MSDQSVTLVDRLFALASAFLLPGLVTLFGISTVNPTVRTWFGVAQSAPTLVGLLFVLFAALAINLVITAVRWYVFEELQLNVANRCAIVGAAPRVNQKNRKDHEAQYLDLRHQHYYHYLAYANTAVAVPIAVAIWALGLHPSWTLAIEVWVLGGVASFVLGRAACHAITRYDSKLLELLGPADAPSPPTPMTASRSAA